MAVSTFNDVAIDDLDKFFREIRMEHTLKPITVGELITSLSRQELETHFVKLLFLANKVCMTRT